MAVTLPVSASVNLFVHILTSPKLPSVPSDLALLDLCAGQMARLEIHTQSSISLPFVREAAQLARNYHTAALTAKVSQDQETALQATTSTIGDNGDAGLSMDALDGTPDNVSATKATCTAIELPPPPRYRYSADMVSQYFDPELLDLEFWSTMAPMDFDFESTMGPLM